MPIAGSIASGSIWHALVTKLPAEERQKADPIIKVQLKRPLTGATPARDGSAVVQHVDPLQPPTATLVEA